MGVYMLQHVHCHPADCCSDFSNDYLQRGGWRRSNQRDAASRNLVGYCRALKFLDYEQEGGDVYAGGLITAAFFACGTRVASIP